MKLYSFIEIKKALIDAAINCTLPSDMNELTEETLFNDDEEVVEKEVQQLGHYISEDSDRYATTNEAYELLRNQSKIDGSVMADEIVSMWHHLEDKYTVDQLLKEIA